MQCRDCASEKLGVGDAVRVTVYQQPDLTTEARITERGGISMPLVGEVKLAGMSSHEAAAKIGDALKEGKYLKHPQVSVALTTLRSQQVSVLGHGGAARALCAGRHQLAASPT